jgi:hypothetical protein
MSLTTKTVAAPFNRLQLQSYGIASGAPIEGSRTDAQVSMGSPASFLHCRGLGKYQPCPAHRETAQVNQVPVVREAVDGRVLAHR